MSSEFKILSMRDMRAIALVAFAPTLVCVALLLHNLARSSSLLWAWSVVCLPAAIFVLKFDYLNPLLAYLLPWTVITLLSTVEISKYSRPVSEKTYTVLLAIEVIVVVTYYLAVLSKPLRKRKPQQRNANLGRYRVLVLFYIAMTGFNVLAAGYIPLIRGIQTGDTGYLDFGVHGIFGFYNAFANALGVLSFYLYLKTGRKQFVWVCVLILAVFVLFVTRGNVISFLVESFVVYCLVRGRVSRRILVAGATAAVILFGVAGNLRSGSVKDIAGVKEEYRSLPDTVIWVYAYSYFNILNFDNVATNPHFPAYDGSSLFGLLPSVLRPTVAYNEQVLEVPEFNVLSYIAPVYADVGLWGAILFTAGVTWWGTWSYQHALEESSFYAITKYSVLFYCALFSFFANFWLYLPIIAQIPLFKGFSEYVLTVERGAAQGISRQSFPLPKPMESGPT